MSVDESTNEDHQDPGLIQQFATLRPTIEQLLNAFARVANVPLVAFLEGTELFRFWPDPQPPICAILKGTDLFAHRCAHDWKTRSTDEEQSSSARCHAGLTTERVWVDLGPFGRLVIFFGAQLLDEPEAKTALEDILREAAASNTVLYRELQERKRYAAHGDVPGHRQKLELLRSIAETIGTLVRAASQFRAMSISMAHEVAVMMIGVGLLSQEAQDSMSEELSDSAEKRQTLEDTHQHIVAECRLGLYIVRNYLSHTSEYRYRQVVRPQFQPVNISTLTLEMADLYARYAEEKQLVIDTVGIDETPTFFGAEMELRRLLHNVLNNAVKYSYRTIPGTTRSVRLWTKNPYDPGFRQKRFSLSVANYGIGIERDELADVMRPGFRGRNAIAEVPIGAGIGLSEASKIMRLHKGEIKLRSDSLHAAAQRGRTFLTTVELIFPYPGQSDRHSTRQ